jgi:hypothetical protein
MPCVDQHNESWLSNFLITTENIQDGYRRQIYLYIYLVYKTEELDVSSLSLGCVNGIESTLGLLPTGDNPRWRLLERLRLFVLDL